MKAPERRTARKIKKKARSERRGRADEQAIGEMLRLCLEKVCELQAELERGGEEEDVPDAETAGYTACALEAIRFLREQGLPADHPMLLTLTEKLQRP